MALQATDWNVVVIGGWNPSILTPNGVSQYVLGLPEGTMVQLELSLDQPGGFRVVHEGFVVTVDPSRLLVQAGACNYQSLNRAAGYALRAIRELPRTPLRAVGLNIRYKDSAVAPEKIPRLLAPIDAEIRAQGFTTKDRRLRRTLDRPPGMINFEITDPLDGTLRIELNFHCSAERRTDAEAWLQMTEADIQGPIDRLVTESLGYSLETTPDAATA